MYEHLQLLGEQFFYEYVGNLVSVVFNDYILSVSWYNINFVFEFQLPND